MGDNDESTRIGRMHEVALVHLPHPHPAVERGGDVRVIDLRLGVVDGGLIGLYGRHQLIDHETLGVVGLLIEHLFGEQIVVALHDEATVGELGLVLCLLGVGLVELRLVRAGIDLRQQITRLHVLALGESHLVELTIDACLHRDGVERLHRAEPVEVNRHIAFFHRARHDGHRQVRTAARTVTAARTAAMAASRRERRLRKFRGRSRQQFVDAARTTMLPRRGPRRGVKAKIVCSCCKPWSDAVRGCFTQVRRPFTKPIGSDMVIRRASQ